MRTIEYRDFSDDVHDRAALVKEKRVPVQGMIELTRLCSVKCVHCYIGDARWIKDPAQMTKEQIFELLDVLHANGTVWLALTGGEAMIRPDFKEIWLHARRKGFILTLFSNATLIDEEMAAFLKKYPPFRVDVSIYGATEETYERVTKIKGSFKRFMRGVENIIALKIPWELKGIIIKENFEDLNKMRELAKQWGVSFRSDVNINPSLGNEQMGGKAPCSTRLDKDQFLEADLSDERVVQYKDVVEKFSKPGRSENLFGCGAGLSSFYIDSQGKLQMCILTPHRGQMLIKKDQSISEAFDWAWNYFAKVREIKRRTDSPCLTCDIAMLCDTCPGFAQLETGDEHGPVEWLCKMAHAKAEKMGVKHNCNDSHFVHGSQPRSMDVAQKEKESLSPA